MHSSGVRALFLSMAVPRLLALLALFGAALAIENGLGRTPPMGWRSWNCFGGNIDTPLIEQGAMACRGRRTAPVTASAQ
jgi:alpha-galactosidase